MSEHEHGIPFFEENYFQHSMRDGALRNRAGTKMAFLPSELVIGLHETLEEELGEAWRDVMQRIGSIWGQRVAARFEDEMTEYYNRPVYELPMREFVRVIEGFFSYQGWGKLTLEFELAEQGLITARLENSAFVEIIGASDGPVDAIAASLLAALVGQLSERDDLVCVETQCAAMGAPECRFVLGIESRLSRVPDWLEEGQSHDEILRTLCGTTVEAAT